MGGVRVRGTRAAALARAGFGEQNMCLIGTLRADGWPRISAQELYIVDGELLLGMMRRSRKSQDLERDARIAVMTPQAEREPTRGDFKAYGRGQDVTDPDLREAYGRTIFEAIGWRPKEPYPLWSVDLDSAAYISFGDNHRLIRWSAERGVEEQRQPTTSRDPAPPTRPERA